MSTLDAIDEGLEEKLSDGLVDELVKGFGDWKGGIGGIREVPDGPGGEEPKCSEDSGLPSSGGRIGLRDGRDLRQTFLGGRDGVSAIHESSQEGLSEVRGCVGGASLLREVFNHESPDWGA